MYWLYFALASSVSYVLRLHLHAFTSRAEERKGVTFSYSLGRFFYHVLLLLSFPFEALFSFPSLTERYYNDELVRYIEAVAEGRSASPLEQLRLMASLTPTVQSGPKAGQNLTSYSKQEFERRYAARPDPEDCLTDPNEYKRWAEEVIAYYSAPLRYHFIA